MGQCFHSALGLTPLQGARAVLRMRPHSMESLKHSCTDPEGKASGTAEAQRPCCLRAQARQYRHDIAAVCITAGAERSWIGMHEQ